MHPHSILTFCVQSGRSAKVASSFLSSLFLPEPLPVVIWAQAQSKRLCGRAAEWDGMHLAPPVRNAGRVFQFSAFVFVAFLEFYKIHVHKGTQ